MNESEFLVGSFSVRITGQDCSGPNFRSEFLVSENPVSENPVSENPVKKYSPEMMPRLKDRARHSRHELTLSPTGRKTGVTEGPVKNAAPVVDETLTTNLVDYHEAIAVAYEALVRGMSSITTEQSRQRSKIERIKALLTELKDERSESREAAPPIDDEVARRIERLLTNREKGYW